MWRDAGEKLALPTGKNDSGDLYKAGFTPPVLNAKLAPPDMAILGAWGKADPDRPELDCSTPGVNDTGEKPLYGERPCTEKSASRDGEVALGDETPDPGGEVKFDWLNI